MTTEAPHADARRTDTRQRILDTAARLFGARGFSGTSIKDIADELGVTKAALYYHFPSKDQILHEMVAGPIAQVEAVVDANPDLTTAPARRRFVRDIIEAMSDCPSSVLAIFKDPALQPQVGAEVAVSGVTDRMAVQLAAGLSGTRDAAGIDPRHLVTATAAVAAGQSLNERWHTIYPDRERYSEDDKSAIVDLVCGILER